MQLKDFDFRVWVGGFAIANGEVWNGGYIDDSYMKENQSNKVMAMGLVRFYDKNKEKLDDIEFFTFYNNVGFNHGVSNDIEIELWSGFHDCKGKKIYENDIIQTTEEIGVVEYNRGTFWVRQENIEPYRLNVAIFEEFMNYGKVEVIGNIHENAKLLKRIKNERK